MRLPMRQRGFSIIELMIIVAILGVIASLAIPSYMRYLRRSKTIEATMNLRKIFDSTVAYYSGQPKTDANGVALPLAFPDSVGGTPAVNGCCGQTGDKCKPLASNFDLPTWSALNFSVDDPFYYWYSFVSSGTGTNAKFDAIANGNLDCDAVYSTYMRSGSVASDNSVRGGAAVFSKLETE